MIHFDPQDQQPPVQIDVAFRALMYCRSVSDPQSLGSPDGERSLSYRRRNLTQLETGMETAAINLLRNWLNGETDLPRTPLDDKCDDLVLDSQEPFHGPWKDDRDNQSNEEEAA